MGSAWFRHQALSITNDVVSENFSLVVLPKHESLLILFWSLNMANKNDFSNMFIFVILFHLQKVNLPNLKFKGKLD